MASPYPVIITLEDHLTPDLQAKVAKVDTSFYETRKLQQKKSFYEFFLPFNVQQSMSTHKQAVSALVALLLNGEYLWYCAQKVYRNNNKR